MKKITKLWRVATYSCDSTLGTMWNQLFFYTKKQAAEKLASVIADTNARHDKHLQYKPRNVPGFEEGFYCACFNTFIGLDSVSIEEGPVE